MLFLINFCWIHLNERFHCQGISDIDKQNKICKKKSICKTVVEHNIDNIEQETVEVVCFVTSQQSSQQYYENVFMFWN